MEGITPEALILALDKTSGVLVIKCDELKVGICNIQNNSDLMRR